MNERMENIRAYIPTYLPHFLMGRGGVLFLFFCFLFFFHRVGERAGRFCRGRGGGERGTFSQGIRKEKLRRVLFLSLIIVLRRTV